MNVLKKSDAKNHRAFGLGEEPPAPRPVIRSGRTGCSMIRSKLARENTTPFAEDFYREHSLTSVSVILMTIPSRSGSVESATRRNQDANKINSPNCVYVG
jgi:hypothetical protein